MSHQRLCAELTTGLPIPRAALRCDVCGRVIAGVYRGLVPTYFAFAVFAFCAAQRLRWASAIRLRASALNTRFLRGPAAGVLSALLVPLVAALAAALVVPVPLKRARTWVSRAISESICAKIESIVIRKGYNEMPGFAQPLGSIFVNLADFVLPTRLIRSDDASLNGRS